MMKQNELLPKRRFEGFTGEWEEYKLSDLAKISTGKAFSSTDFDDKGKYYVVTNKNIQDQSISIESVGSRINISEKLVLDNYVLRGNNILITMDGNVGRAGKYSDDNAVLAQRVARLNSKQFEFVYQITRKSQFISKMNEVSVGNIIKHISLKQISDYLFMAPKDKKEQQKIGQFFKNLDEMIVLQQRKLDKTRALKSAYLAEMFPTEGESVPKRRFEGFTGEWEEYKLSDLAKISTGKAFSSTDFDDKGKYYVVTNKNIQDQSISIESVGSRINISEKLVLDNYVLRGNNILITMDGNVGRVGKYSDDNAVLAQRVARLNSKQFEFVYQITRKSQFISKMNEVSVGNIIKHISLKQISDYLFMAPKDKKEQQKIGQFFKNLDEMIATHQQKLEKLKATKQAYLHEMFV